VAVVGAGGGRSCESGGIPSTTIAPGDALTVHLAFDVPESTLPTNLTLRQSDTSAGVTIALS
jgi:hypothetical protein